MFQVLERHVGRRLRGVERGLEVLGRRLERRRHVRPEQTDYELFEQRPTVGRHRAR